MNSYIGAKLIKAEPMTKGNFDIMKNGQLGFTMEDSDIERLKVNTEDGYMVKYPDGYTSWSPKAVFESAYLKVEDNPDLASGVSIGNDMIDNFIDYHMTMTLGDKTTIVIAFLVNGFEIVESTGCVDPANYDESIGEKICLDRIKNKIWSYLGFLLQTAWCGVKPEK